MYCHRGNKISTTDLQHLLSLKLTFQLLATEVLEYIVQKARVDLVELLVCDLHAWPGSLQRIQDFDCDIIGSHQDKGHRVHSLVHLALAVHPEVEGRKHVLVCFHYAEYCPQKKQIFVFPFI